MVHVPLRTQLSFCTDTSEVTILLSIIIITVLIYIQVDLAIHTEQKLPWIRRKLKKTFHRVEKSPNVSFFLRCYYKIYEKLSGNSFYTLEKKVTQLESQEKLQSLLQGIGVCLFNSTVLSNNVYHGKCNAYITLANLYSPSY